jgi:glycosyltransferase involved in cell wall biosynthesis
MSPRKSVLLTTSTFPQGPDDAVSARFVLDLARRLRRHYRVHVLAPDAPGLPKSDDWDGVRIHRYTYFLPRRLQVLARGEGALANVRAGRLAKLQVPLLVLSQLAALPGVVRRHGIDLVNSHWVVPQGFTAAVWRRMIGVPHVVTCHAAGVFLLRRRHFGRAFARFIADRTDLFLPVSRFLLRTLEGVAGRPLPHRVIPMGVDAGGFRPDVDPSPIRRQHAPSGEKLILFVGKLVPKKGVDVLLRALAQLRDDCRLILVGGGPLEEKIEAEIRELGLTDRVVRTGWLRNEALPAYYAAADVICVPSVTDAHGETEGMPVVVQEAMACGKTLVASDVSGIPDVVRDGVDGFLVRERDVDGLATALTRAMAVPPDGPMSRAARETAERHTWEAIADRYADAFDSVLP